MPIDFTLSPAQSAVRAAAASFARNELLPARTEYLRHHDQKERFQAQQTLHEAAMKTGLVKTLIAKSLGGTSGTLVDAVLMVEA